MSCEVLQLSNIPYRKQCPLIYIQVALARRVMPNITKHLQTRIGSNLMPSPQHRNHRKNPDLGLHNLVGEFYCGSGNLGKALSSKGLHVAFIDFVVGGVWHDLTLKKVVDAFERSILAVYSSTIILELRATHIPQLVTQSAAHE